MYDIAHIYVLDESKGRLLLEWENYDMPFWEDENAIYDEKGRCQCPQVLYVEEWRLFQASLVVR